jgi:bacterioferritin (cytochrome b1)
MNKTTLIDKLNGDLRNEYTHMNFYLHSSFLVEGTYRHEVAEWLVEHAESEFKHIQEFAKMIVGLGGVPITDKHSFPNLTDPHDIFLYAQKLEQEVVTNYAHRMEDIVGSDELGRGDAKYVELFLEDQLLDSRGDLDEIAQFLKGH